jgi:hypothetical protein
MLLKDATNPGIWMIKDLLGAWENYTAQPQKGLNKQLSKVFCIYSIFFLT